MPMTTNRVSELAKEWDGLRAARMGHKERREEILRELATSGTAYQSALAMARFAAALNEDYQRAVFFRMLEALADA